MSDDVIDVIPGGGPVNAGGGNDRVNGSDVQDDISGGGQNDTIFGNEGNDILDGNDNADIIHGGGGLDTISGGSGQDRLHGDAGNDRMEGNLGLDMLFGGGGNDRMDGGGDNDMLVGGDHSDAIQGGDGDDKLYGDNVSDGNRNEGFADFFVFDKNDGHDKVFDFENGIDSIALLEGMDDLTFIQNGGRTVTMEYGNTVVKLFNVGTFGANGEDITADVLDDLIGTADFNVVAINDVEDLF